MSELVQAEPAPSDGRADPVAALQRIAALEAEVARLNAARAGRDRIARVCGMVAERYGLSSDGAWELLVAVSQSANVKLREVARVVEAGSCQLLTGADAELAVRLNRLAPPRAPLVRLGREPVA